MTPFARTIIESELVAKRIDSAAKEAPRLYELYEGIKWKLSRNPTGSTNVVDLGDGWYMAKTYSWAPGGLPSITVLYRVNDHEVIIESSKIQWPRSRTRS